ncbi:MlaE family lipid ABC transporter permease subunit [Sandarakinorhabdus sp.]|uniref:ABC transporter permease n=1 Tax=Sandarakinorhabdus sp. TaxID=1916663 RepID=UPI00286E99BB|nr:MlaE family lipid ABC transporter permease subunit [Sandarakinorhabdus sp.]
MGSVLRFESDDAGDGARRIAFAGPLTMANISGIVGDVRAIVPSGSGLSIDLSAVDDIDTSGAWIVHRLITSWADAGITAQVDNASEEASRLITEVAANDAPVPSRPPRGQAATDRLERIGRALAFQGSNIVRFIGFLGQTLVVLGETLIGRRKLRWHAIIHQCEMIGVNALTIVGLLLFLVGLVVAQQGAVQLRQFGAEVFTVNLIGRATTRELGILLTAIMVAGRSGSAFAAQIGSMKLNQEVDALTTIGLSPIEVLVVPRVIACAIMLFLLAFFGNIMALVGGGVFVWLDFGLSPGAYVQRLQEVTPLSDFVIGMIKAPVFGIIIALMGCFHGLQVTGNAESVGSRTTQAVVEAIFVVIVFDAFFAFFFSALGYN